MYKRRVKVRSIVPGGGLASNPSSSVSVSSSVSSVSLSKSVENKENDASSDNNVDEEMSRPSSPCMFDEADEQPAKKQKTDELFNEEEKQSQSSVSQMSPEVVSRKTQKNNLTSQVKQSQKISQKAPEVQRTVSKNKANIVSQAPNSSKPGFKYLKEVTRFSGMKIHSDTRPNELEKDQAVFVQSVSTFLTKDENSTKKNVQLFMEDLKIYCDDHDHFKNALLPTQTVEGSEVQRGEVQDSMIRLLLQVDALHNPLTQFLIDKMAELTADPSQKDEWILWVRMIVQALKFLNMPSTDCALGEQLLAIVYAASDVGVQQEIINSLPEIIRDDEHHDCALELSKFLRNKSLLLSVLDALSNLSLQNEIQTEVQEMLINALRKSPPDFLPNMVKFSLSSCNLTNVDKVINGLRTELSFKDIDSDAESNSKASTSITNNQILVFSKIENCLLLVKFLYNAWLKNIGNARNHRPIDVVILLILYKLAADETRRRAVIAVFRKKIKEGLFKEKLIKETLKTFIVVIKEHFNSLMKIASSLLKSPEASIVKYAGCIYSDLFEQVKGYWCKWIIDELLLVVGSGKAAGSTAAYKVLHNLASKHQKKIRPYSTLLIVLLNRLDELALSEARQVMDMLSQIAYSNDDDVTDCTALQDELNMLVQKQISSLQPSVVYCGVVSATMLLKHMASLPPDESNSHVDRSIEEASLSVYAQKAYPLLELILSGCRDRPEVLQLTLDQLSFMLMGSKTFDQTLIHRMSNIMKTKIQDMYLVATNEFEPTTELLPLKLMFCLDEDLNENVAINIGGCVIQEFQMSKKPGKLSSGKWPISCVQPLLRLLKDLEKHDLTEIDALLGCPIILPALHVYTAAEFGSLTPGQQHAALHCLFHVINWLREILSSFAFLVRQKEPNKVLMRLRTIIYLQDFLSQCLPLTTEYTPPSCFFQQSTTKIVEKKSADKGARKKRKRQVKKKKGDSKKKGSADTSVLTAQEEVAEEEDGDSDDDDDQSETQSKRADLSSYSGYFRELDIDVWLLFTRPLVLNPAPEKDGKFTPELGPCELLFLLDDFKRKVAHSLPDSVKRILFFKTSSNNNSQFETLDTLEPHLIAKNTIKLIPSLCAHLEKTVEFSQNLIRINDEILDAPGMFLEGSSEIKQCQHRLLSIFGILFSWSGFQSDAHNDLLITGLQKMADRMTQTQTKTASKKLLVQEIFKYLSVCGSKILDMNTAEALITLMKALCTHAGNDPALQKTISTLCYKFLVRSWYDFKGNKEQGVLFNKQLLMLLATYFSNAEDRQEALTETTSWMSKEIELLTDKESSFNTFVVFNKSNLNILLKGVLDAIETCIKVQLAAKPSDKKQLNLWMSTVIQMENIVTVLKAQDSRACLGAFLKGSISILRLFLNNGMTVCNYMFKTESNDVSAVLKKLQVTTRYLHTVLNYVKVSKVAGFQQYLPAARSVMESIILQVKNTIVLNNCTDAFYLGSVKNRDLKGQEILSQVDDDDEISTIGKTGEQEEEDEEEDDNGNDDNEDNEAEEAEEEEEGQKSEDNEDDRISDLY
ncbi:Fanconi anemia group D2 protein isoform X2 [Nilaparvata lugens]|uniref:Fanconi anemia group D2 protein isoform X2 n=1 Tax=Nilaparvata lugens TaxID=108931 RepID=UPI00193CB98C|nr:Fanconi anemia group D2 protein isoform X2 [Nilaparvata lugens]